MIDLRKGLPEWFFAPRFAVAMGLFVGGAFVLATTSYAAIAQWLKRDPVTAPACYGADRAYTPGTEFLPPRGAEIRGRPSVDVRNLMYLERLREAEKICTAQSCNRPAWEDYRSALFWYLSDRMTHTRKLDSNYGTMGLVRAFEIYGTAQDQQVEQGLRDRYQARIFRIKDFRQNQDAVAILVLYGGTGLRPCRKSDVVGWRPPPDVLVKRLPTGATAAPA